MTEVEGLMGGIKTSIIKIGNSRGIRISKAILEQCHLRGGVELETRVDHMVVRSAKKPRRGWEEVFRAMAERGEDLMVERAELVETSWEKDEWQCSLTL